MPVHPADRVPSAGAHGTRGGVLILVAGDFEARGLTRRLPSLRAPTGPGNGGPLLRSVGLGAANLARLQPALAAARPEAVLVTGLAGGCAGDVASGEIVVGSLVGPTASGTWLVPPAALLNRALRALDAAAVPYHVGRLVTVAEVVATPAAKAHCWRTHGALAADMESAHVLAWAAHAGLPALAVRAVADGPADALPPALARALGPDGDVRLRTTLAWLGQPARLAAAWRLWRRSRLALERLARFLAAFTAFRP